MECNGEKLSNQIGSYMGQSVSLHLPFGLVVYSTYRVHVMKMKQATNHVSKTDHDQGFFSTKMQHL